MEDKLKRIITKQGWENNGLIYKTCKPIFEDIWKEAQKELLEEFQKEMYEQNVGYICDFEIQHKLEELSLETNNTSKEDNK